MPGGGGGGGQGPSPEEQAERQRQQDDMKHNILAQVLDQHARARCQYSYIMVLPQSQATIRYIKFIYGTYP